jgi:hypothetical protein
MVGSILYESCVCTVIAPSIEHKDTAKTIVPENHKNRSKPYLTNGPRAGSVHRGIRTTGKREGSWDFIGDALGVSLSVDGLDVEALGGLPGQLLLGVLSLELLGRHLGPLFVKRLVCALSCVCLIGIGSSFMMFVYTHPLLVGDLCVPKKKQEKKPTEE